MAPGKRVLRLVEAHSFASSYSLGLHEWEIGWVMDIGRTATIHGRGPSTVTLNESEQISNQELANCWHSFRTAVKLAVCSLQRPNFHYRHRSNLILDPVLCQLCPIHILTSYFLRCISVLLSHLCTLAKKYIPFRFLE